MASVKKRPDGRWRARYRDLAGKEHARHFARRVDAERWVRSVETAKDRGEWIDPALGRVTFAEWAIRWESTVVDLRASTLYRDLGLLRNHITPRFGPVPLVKVQTSDVRAWVAEMVATGRHSPATVRKAGQVLAKVMRAAVDDGLIARSPCVGVRLPAEGSREMAFLSAAQVVELVDATDEHYRVLVATAAYLGLRWGELAGLRTERVDLLRRQVSVVEQLTEVSGALTFGPPKTAAGRRSVSAPAFLCQMLGEQLTERAEPSGLVFPAREGGPMRRSNFRRRAWASATRRADLVGFRFHDLRHTAVALAIGQGAHPKAIQERMGHGSITTTLDRYGHLFPGLDEVVAEGLDATWRDARADSLRTGGGPSVVELQVSAAN
jgi:integrase